MLVIKRGLARVRKGINRASHTALNTQLSALPLHSFLENKTLNIPPLSLVKLVQLLYASGLYQGLSQTLQVSIQKIALSWYMR
jgi:hypothetical protein